MNLITKTTIFFLLVALLAFGIGGVVAYVLVKNEVQKETDFALKDQLEELSEEIGEGLPLSVINRGKVEVQDLGPEKRDTFIALSDTLAPHPYLDDVLEPYRRIDAVRRIDGTYYRFMMTDVFIETDDIYDVVVDIMLRLFLYLGAAMLLFSFLITRWLLLPFYKTLDQIRKFTVQEPAPIVLPKTSTKEFRQLNAFLQQMTFKARREYLSVKEFSENASHEIQTPLAVAQGKLELLLETPGLSNEQLNLLHSIQQSIARLSRLGKALQLLAKIENQEFPSREPVDFSHIVERSIDNFSELAGLKSLALSKRIEPNVLIPVDPILADIMIGNLLKNAVRHNLENGWIEVVLSQEKLVVRNPGQPPRVPPQQLFERFQKSQQRNASLGLGLAIVKKITEASGFRVSYEFEAGAHQLSVIFS